MGKLLGQSWEQLADIARQGTWAENNIEIGDYKALTLNGTVGTVALNNYTTYATVIGFDHNKDKEIIGYPHAITFGLFADVNARQLALVDQYYDGSSVEAALSFAMNPGTSSAATNAGGWKKAKIRKNILGSTDVENGDATPATITSPGANTFMAALPADLRTVLKPITKYTDNTGHKATGESVVTSTIDYLPLMAEFEAFGIRSNANENEKTYQAQYQYYKNGNSKIKYKYSDTSTAVLWWLRSPSRRDYTSFCYVGSAGVISSGGFYATLSWALTPIFNICSDGSPDYINIDQTTSTVVLATKDTHVSKDISVQAILSEKTVTPTTTAQTVTPSNNTVGFSKVTVNAVPTEEKTVTTNGEVTPSTGKFLSKVTVNVPAPAPTLQEKTATPTTTTQNISPDSGYDGLSNVRISAIQTETKTIAPTTSVQDVTPTSGKYFSKVTVNAVLTEEKTATSNGEVTPSTGKFLSKVTVNVPATAYDQFVKVGDDIDCSSLPYGDSYTITSSAPTIVEAENDGGVWRATAKAAGSATITVTETTADGDVVKGKLTVGVAAKDSLTGTATASDVASGKTFYNTDAKTKITGTLEEWGKLKQLSGTWQFKTSVNLTNDVRGDFQFQTYNGGDIGYGRIVVYGGSPSTRRILAYRRNDGTLIQVYNNYSTGSTAGWNLVSQEYRNITLESPQSVSEEFYNWFTANATQTGGSSTGTDFTITANGTTELTDLNGKIIRKVPKVLVNVPAPTPTLQEKTATSNGTVTPDAGYDGLSKVTVNVPSTTITLQEKTVTPSTSSQTVTADSSYTGLSKVTVNAIQTETKAVAPSSSVQNITPTSGKYLTKVTVSAVATNNLTVNQNGTFTPNSGTYYGTVTVNVPTDGYNQVVNVGADVDVSNLPYDDAYTIASSSPTVASAENDGGAWLVSALSQGQTTITVKETTPDGDVIKGQLTVLVLSTAGGKPIEITTAAEMNNLLVAANVGKVYKFTGTTDSTYTNGEIYEVVST